MSTDTDEAWWIAFYDTAFADLVLARDPTTEVRWLHDALALTPGQRIFDQCAGTGRVALALAERGLRVAGVDQCAEYVARARAAAKARGVDSACEFAHGDARTYVPPAACDAAINWYTSFGHALDERDDEALLARAFEALRPGGRFALEYANTAHLLAAFREHLVQRVGDAMIVRESRLDLGRGTLEQRWTYLLASGERRERSGRTRLHLPHTLVAMARRVGFVEITLEPGPGATGAFGPASPRCVLLARRPAAATAR